MICDYIFSDPDILAETACLRVLIAIRCSLREIGRETQRERGRELQRERERERERGSEGNSRANRPGGCWRTTRSVGHRCELLVGGGPDEIFITSRSGAVQAN